VQRFAPALRSGAFAGMAPRELSPSERSRVESGHRQGSEGLHAAVQGGVGAVRWRSGQSDRVPGGKATRAADSESAVGLPILIGLAKELRHACLAVDRTGKRRRRLLGPG
jgi:hypothetical protein